MLSNRSEQAREQAKVRDADHSERKARLGKVRAAVGDFTVVPNPLTVWASPMSSLFRAKIGKPRHANEGGGGRLSVNVPPY